MATLLLENVPFGLLDRIQRYARRLNCAPGEAVVEVLDLVLSNSPPPNPIFLDATISAPFDLPRPIGEIVPASQVKTVPPSLPDPSEFFNLK